MGLGGVPWEPPVDIFSAIKKHHGVVTHVVKELDCCPETFYRYVRKHPEIQKYLDEQRKVLVNKKLDVAENVLYKKMADDSSQDQLKAAIYYLNNQGKDRNYAHPDADKHNSDSFSIKQINAAIAEHKNNGGCPVAE